VVAATPILMLAIVLVYLPGSVVGGEVTPLYLFLALGALYVGQTFYDLSHRAWGAELSTDYHERSRIQAFSEWISTAGGLAILAIPIFFEVFVDASRMGPRVEALAWFALVAIPLSVAANVLLVPERESTPSARTSFRAALKLLLGNSHLLRIAAIDALYWLQVGISSGLMVFFVKYWIEVPEGTTAVVFISQAGTLVAIPIWAKLSRRVGKHRAVGAAFAIHLLTHCFYPLIGAGDIALFWGLALVSGLGGASATFLLRSITVDIVDYDNWKSGEERTALFFAVLSTTMRIAPSIAVGIAFPLLALLGFDPSAAKPDAHAIQVVRWTYIAVPVLAVGGAAWLARGFQLDERTQQELRRAIEARGPAGALSADPGAGGRREPGAR
jgi:Na+/melibiose symporter-like transporter